MSVDNTPPSSEERGTELARKLREVQLGLLSVQLKAAMDERRAREKRGLPQDGRADNVVKAIRKVDPTMGAMIGHGVLANELNRLAGQAVQAHAEWMAKQPHGLGFRNDATLMRARFS